MFNKQNFCHIASNNRNDVKVGVFVYKTTDDLATVSVSGYFNEKIIDINLHDLIIHEWHDPADRTKVQRNVLCVTERTLDNVGTVVIKSKWEGDIEQDIADIEQEIIGLANVYLKLDGTNTMTGPLKMRSSVSFKCAIAPSWDGVGFYKLNDNDSLTLMASMESTDGLTPAQNNTYNIGKASHKWKDAHIARVITAVLNNGYDIAVPVTNQAETLALKSDVDLAANSGRMITDEGVWYAKMDAAGTIPAGAAVEGRNYADFTQVDVDNNPIIVIYTYTSGAWTQTEIITPPAEYDGYVPVTSKIWDIQEQAGQQGGRILWNHQSKDFTPYPLIISFEDAHLTGTPTAPTPTGSSPDEQVANKGYVKSQALAAQTLSLNMEITGSLSGIYDGNLSGFSATNWVKIPGKIDLSGYHYDIDFSLTTGSTISSSSQDIFFSVNNQGDLNLATDNSNEIQFCGNATGFVLAPDTKYYFRITKDGSTLYLSHSSDGVSYTVIAQASSLTGANDYYGFNVNLDTNGESILHATETSVTIDNIIVWKAMDAPGLHTKVTKGHEVIEFQAPTAQNNYKWYRKYADGWVEQGGKFDTGSDQTASNAWNITLAVEMADNNYTGIAVSGGRTSGGQFGSYIVVKNSDCTTTKLSVYVFKTETAYRYINWTVSGMAA